MRLLRFMSSHRGTQICIFVTWHTVDTRARNKGHGKKARYTIGEGVTCGLQSGVCIHLGIVLSNVPEVAYTSEFATKILLRDLT